MAAPVHGHHILCRRPHAARTKATHRAEEPTHARSSAAGRYHLLVVDEDGTAKACSRKRFPLVEALRLVERLPLPVAAGGELSQVLQEQDLREDAREHGLHVEV